MITKMKILGLLALVASGCTTSASVAVCGDGILDPGEGCDDGNNISGDGCSATCTVETVGRSGYITAKWDLTNVAHQHLDCPGGFDTAALYSQEVDASFNNVGAPVIDLFNSTDFTGRTAALSPTTYYSWVSIANTNNSSQYATSTEAFVDLTAADKTYSADILEDGGYFQFQWALTLGGNPTTCAAQANVKGIESVSTDTANSSNFASDIFPCADHVGITSGFSAGMYTVSIDALNASNQAIGTPVNLTNKTITAPNKVTNLGTVTIPLD
jgi:cysteine-rich repeat protein